MNNPSKFETALDTYAVREIIGEGGSGRVFRVTDSDGQSFALKCLSPERLSSDRRRRFKNELFFLRNNRHANIVRVVDDGVIAWGGATTPFYVMPLYGGTLRSTIGSIPRDGVAAVMAQILDGVEAAHNAGVIHRDLKPENILVDTDANRYLVADFGAANFEEEQLLTAVETRANDRLANFVYAAPEQRVRGGEICTGTDIYALGLIWNEIITGMVIQGSDYKTIASVDADLAYLDEIIVKMVRQDSGARYRSVDELKKDLIGLRNAFVARQRLDAVRGQTVRVHEVEETPKIALTGADWNGGVLTITLNQAPTREWIQCFQFPLEGYSSLLGLGPPSYQFHGNLVCVQCEGRQAQTIIDQAKTYIQMADRGHRQLKRDQAREAEMKERRDLEAQQKAADERARVLASLKI
jgi:serine/threonine protein kinase